MAAATTVPVPIGGDCDCIRCALVIWSSLWELCEHEPDQLGERLSRVLGRGSDFGNRLPEQAVEMCRRAALEATSEVDIWDLDPRVGCAWTLGPPFPRVLSRRAQDPLPREPPLRAVLREPLDRAVVSRHRTSLYEGGGPTGRARRTRFGGVGCGHGASVARRAGFDRGAGTHRGGAGAEPPGAADVGRRGRGWCRGWVTPAGGLLRAILSRIVRQRLSDTRGAGRLGTSVRDRGGGLRC